MGNQLSVMPRPIEDGKIVTFPHPLCVSPLYGRPFYPEQLIMAYFVHTGYPLPLDPLLDLSFSWSAVDLYLVFRCEINLFLRFASENVEMLSDWIATSSENMSGKISSLL